MIFKILICIGVIHFLLIWPGRFSKLLFLILLIPFGVFLRFFHCFFKLLIRLELVYSYKHLVDLIVKIIFDLIIIIIILIPKGLSQFLTLFQSMLLQSALIVNLMFTQELGLIALDYISILWFGILIFISWFILNSLFTYAFFYYIMNLLQVYQLFAVQKGVLKVPHLAFAHLQQLTDFSYFLLIHLSFLLKVPFFQKNQDLVLFRVQHIDRDFSHFLFIPQLILPAP